jgi:hypothetical protein
MLVWTIAFMGVSLPVWALDDFEEPPINYSTAPADNPVSQLQKEIDAKAVALEYDDEFGYTKSLLEILGVPLESQVLVFSKTSFQNHRITPDAPRAIYFNDDVYIGAVQGGDVLEISTADPKLGAVFYSLSQQRTSRPEFVRQDNNCLQCHGSTLTRGVPGHMMRSVYPDEVGFPVLQAGTHLTDDRSPFEERWGGWYVTGTHGSERHMGNVIAQETERSATVDMELGANHGELAGRVNTEKYLTVHSDIVALMVLGHQTRMHNVITEANFDTQYALRDQMVMDGVLDRDSLVLSASSERRIANAGEKLIRALLFADEVPLLSTVEGSSSFAAVFPERGPKDPWGRSLRTLDLRTRLFRYPLSYLIYSPQFLGLPREMKDFVYGRLWEILNDPRGLEYPHISASKKNTIRQILTYTLADLPAYWRAAL